MANVGNTSGGYPDSSRFRDQNVVLGGIRVDTDGWITGLTVRAAGLDSNTPAKVVIYTDNNELVFSSAQQTWDTVIRDRSGTVEAGKEIRVKAGTRFKCGFWGHPSYTRKWDQYPMPSIFNYRTATGGFDIPGFIAALKEWIYALTCWMHHTPNQKPVTGVWNNSSPSGLIGDFDPIFEGTMPHHPSEANKDYTKLVNVRIFDVTNNNLVVNATFAPSAQERQQGFFSRQFYTHTVGRSYYAEFRHQDSFDIWSDMSARTNYQVVNGPARPTFPTDGLYGQNLPRTKTNLSTGIRYHAKYAHPNGTALSQMQVEVWNGEHSIKLYDSGMLTPSLMTNASNDFGLNQWHAALPENSAFAYRVRAKDTAGVTGGWSNFYDFRTNARPYKPTKPFPEANLVDSAGLLSVEVGDPDKDRLSIVRFKIYNLSNTLVGTIDKTDVDSGTRAVIDARSVMTIGTTYEFTAEAYDGALWGAPTSRNRFIYDYVPITSMLFPSSDPVINQAVPPSAEHTGADTAVTLTGTDTNKSFIVTADADAQVGEHAWAISKLGGNGTAIFELSSNRPAQPGENWVVGAGLKAETGTINAKLELACYTGSGVYISSVALQAGTDTLATHTAISESWNLYGGVTNAVLPANTAFVRPRVVADNASAGDFRVDGWVLVKVPAGAPTATFADNFFAWFGYFDGDSTEYIVSEDAYSWMGDVGASASKGRNILTKPAIAGVTVAIGYNQPSGAGKAADRMVIERHDGTSYKPSYDSGWVSSNRTAIPLPAQGQIVNEGSYRVRITTRDTNTREGTSPWAYFDVLYEGPHELVVRSVGGDSSRGVITIAWDATQEPHDDLKVFEVRVSSAEEGTKTIARITDFNTTQFDYPFPVSGRSYTVEVRQIKLIGEAEVASLWEGDTSSVDYFPYYFLKDINDPTNMLVFDPVRGNLPTATHTKNIDEYESLFGGAPMHVVGNNEYHGGSLVATLTGEEELGLIPGEQLTAAKHFASKRFCCIMGHLHPEKVFSVLKGVDYRTTDYLAPEVSFSWTETRYEEDIYAREGYKI